MALTSNLNSRLHLSFFLLAAVLTVTPGASATYTATYSEGINYGGGACNYEGDFSNSPFFDDGMTAYVPQAKYRGGKACGTCYEIACKNSPSCRRSSVAVRAVGQQGGDNFLLSDDAWDEIVRDRSAGRVEIKYRSVACPRNGGIAVKIMPGSNAYWFAVQVLGAAKAGAVEAVELSKDGGRRWASMSVLGESATWVMNPAKEIVDAGRKVSVRVTAVGNGKQVVLRNVIPVGWSAAQTYESSANF
ncbi:hypothetical protein CLOM_g8873 [Closterium sp. NIES-68]|nr:hypothetical protein CLOM_g14974 [Closterium sp. NIES-68]GJP49691.1 hypothetical protein CLOM_g8873 [Closterium sp. NIES-68]GJP74215.1 hypothetical protein CLOP_g4837 [Closterium sp. NIES-67]GJP80227.1 hypothetical protein CLOP_g10454 [Closterium sp. NIES-67]